MKWDSCWMEVVVLVAISSVVVGQVGCETFLGDEGKYVSLETDLYIPDCSSNIKATQSSIPRTQDCRKYLSKQNIKMKNMKLKLHLPLKVPTQHPVCKCVKEQFKLNVQNIGLTGMKCFQQTFWSMSALNVDDELICKTICLENHYPGLKRHKTHSDHLYYTEENFTCDNIKWMNQETRTYSRYVIRLDIKDMDTNRDVIYPLGSLSMFQCKLSKLHCIHHDQFYSWKPISDSWKCDDMDSPFEKYYDVIVFNKLGLIILRNDTFSEYHTLGIPSTTIICSDQKIYVTRENFRISGLALQAAKGSTINITSVTMSSQLVFNNWVQAMLKDHEADRNRLLMYGECINTNTKIITGLSLYQIYGEKAPADLIKSPNSTFALFRDGRVIDIYCPMRKILRILPNMDYSKNWPIITSTGSLYYSEIRRIGLSDPINVSTSGSTSLTIPMNDTHSITFYADLTYRINLDVVKVDIEVDRSLRSLIPGMSLTTEMLKFITLASFDKDRLTKEGREMLANFENLYLETTESIPDNTFRNDLLAFLVEHIPPKYKYGLMAFSIILGLVVLMTILKCFLSAFNVNCHPGSVSPVVLVNNWLKRRRTKNKYRPIQHFGDMSDDNQEECREFYMPATRSNNYLIY